MRRKIFLPTHVKAFTLIELLVSVSIMAVILGITLSGGPQALMRLNLSDQTYTVELMLREAQLQGSAVNSLSGIFGGAGIYFTNASTTNILKFRDIIDPTIRHSIGIGNGLYDTIPVNEVDKIQVISGRNKISQLCVSTGTGPFLCNSSNTPQISNLTISFLRPRQDAYIYINNSTSTSYSAACIQLDAPKAPERGYVRSVHVYASGMITKRVGPCYTP